MRNVSANANKQTTMKLILKFAFLGILIQGLFFDKVSGLTLDYKTDRLKDTCKCNYSCWPVIKDSINGLTEQQILSFLKSLGHDCDNNVEFSEVSNETLFKIMEFNSARFISVIEKHQTEIEFSKILKMIENPINDGVDLVKMSKLVNNVKIDSETKSRIIESLKTAINKTR